MSLTNTPNANRLHIALYGRRNSGKSSLINALTGQNTALVSEYAGTTTDPVYKAMELHPIGPVLFIDTAGFDDEGELGRLRVEKTEQAVARTDMALVLLSEGELSLEKQWIEKLKKRNIPVIAVINKIDILKDAQALAARAEKALGQTPVCVSALKGDGIPDLREALVRALPEDYERKSITGDLVGDGDLVMLVMPQDIQAPKGRLILPQVQTTRELLDKKCVIISTTADRYELALEQLAHAPKLIITDSQCFKQVYEHKPQESLLTSFSVLFAGYKGDINAFVAGAAAIDKLGPGSRVLIAEACTHAPLSEDIGRVKIPRALRARYGQQMQIDIVAGVDFPKDLSPYDLVIHCGGCMFNRKYVLSRVEAAQAADVPITNYGVALAKLTGILDKISFAGR